MKPRISFTSAKIAVPASEDRLVTSEINQINVVYHCSESQTCEITSNDLKDSENIPTVSRSHFEDPILTNNDLFAEKDSNLGRTNSVEMSIDTSDHPPIRKRPFHNDHKSKNRLKNFFDAKITALARSRHL